MSPNDKWSAAEIKRVLKRTSPIEEADYIELEKWRALLFKMGVFTISHSDLICYSNLSKRLGNAAQFIITGENTSQAAHLDGFGYAKVNKLDAKKNLIEAQGVVAPPLQGFWHGLIYSKFPWINALFQIESEALSRRLEEEGAPRLTAKSLVQPEEETEIPQSNSGVCLFEAKAVVFIWGSSVETAGKKALEILKLARK